MATDQEANVDSLLSLHVIGSGIGESIILQIPHETVPGAFHWGVVDCYASSEDPNKNPTLNFLREHRALGALRIDFVCVTHPHEDHLYGLWHLFADPAFSIDKFWRFPTDGPSLLRTYAYLAQETPNHEIYPRLQRELNNLFEHTKEHRRDTERYRRWTNYNPNVYTREIHTIETARPVLFRIASLAPSSKQLDRHSDHLAACFLDFESPREWEFDPTRFDRRIHNAVSVVLLVTFGETRILLGADAEIDSWKDIMNDSRRKADGCDLQCEVVKASHHGSETGFYEPAWKEHASQHTPVTIITPYERGSSRLPGPAMLQKFAGYASEVHVTSRPGSIGKSSTGIRSGVLRRRKARHVAGRAIPVRGKTVRMDHRGHVLRVDDLTIE